MTLPELSAYWITVPLGILMFLWLAWEQRALRRIAERRESTVAAFSTAPERISFVDLLKEFENGGLNFLGDNPTILSVCKELRQAASDGTLQIWGRDRRASDPLVLVPQTHWREFNIDWIEAVIVGPPSGVIKGFASDNFFVGTRTFDHRKAYYDLHVNRLQALALSDRFSRNLLTK